MIANPFYRPLDPLKGFEHDELLTGKEGMRGHPTAPGPRDEYRNRVPAPSPGNGTPGLPRLTMRPMSHGPGIPGTTPSGPMQPDVRYEGEPDE